MNYFRAFLDLLEFASVFFLETACDSNMINISSFLQPF